MNKKIIVLSGINLIEGGPLTIYKECLRYVENYLLENYEIVALVHSKELFSEFDSRIKFVECRDSKKSYLKRMYYEYIYLMLDIWKIFSAICVILVSFSLINRTKENIIIKKKEKILNIKS